MQRKHKRNCAVANSKGESSESEDEQQQPLPKKPKRAKTTSNKENMPSTEKTAFKAKTKKTADRNKESVAGKKQKVKKVSGGNEGLVQQDLNSMPTAVTPVNINDGDN